MFSRSRYIYLLLDVFSNVYNQLLTAFKLIHGKMGISVEDVGIHLCHGVTRDGGFRLQQECPASALLQSFFKHRVPSL